MYKVNDTVVYSTYGVCTITGIEEKDFCGQKAEYYVLSPAGDSKNKFFVPTSNAALAEKMRPVLSKTEVEELISDMPDEELICIEDENKRKEVFRNIIGEGDRHKLVKLIKSLYLHKQELAQQHKKLHSADERFLAEAENMLYDEFAYALGISRNEVLPYITAAVSK